MTARPFFYAVVEGGGTGLNLTANHVVHLIKLVNPAVENQATTWRRAGDGAGPPVSSSGHRQLRRRSTK